MKNVKIVCIQITSKSNDFDFNIDKILIWIKKAFEDHKPDMIVFPETVTTGFAPGMPLSEFYNLLPDNIEEKLEPVKKLCKKLNLYCVVPSYEKAEQQDIIYNSAFFIGRNGDLLGKYSKTHLFPTERLSGGGWSTAGEDYPVFDTDFGKVGIMLCYEGDFPEISRILAVQGAEIILRPSALLRSYDIWEMTNKARAYDNHTYIVAVNAVGTDASGNCYFGHSMIISPIAQKLALARGTEEIICMELESDPIKYVTYGSKSPMLFDHLEDRNVKTYKDFLTREAKSGFEPFKRIK